MQIIAADIGNSSIKYAVSELEDFNSAGEPIVQSSWTIDPRTRIEHLQIDSAAPWFVSSVNPQYLQQLKQHVWQRHLATDWRVLSHDQVPLRIDVEQPAGVGMDRLLAAWAARNLCDEQRDAIVIDCGTALTIDLVDTEHVYHGGVILAGPAASLLALSSLTAALPDLSHSKISRPTHVVGRSTQQAMLSGAYYAGLGAIKEVVSQMARSRARPTQVVGTGGGLGPWRDALPSEWMLVDNLVLNGIVMVAAKLLSRT